MTWVSLNLWADEEKRILTCLTEALQQLIVKRIVNSTDEEKTITGKLRPILRNIRKLKGLAWTLQFEVSSFEQDDDSEPIARPDIRFTFNDPEYNQCDYDVECKLVRVNRLEADTDYCYNYVRKGVLRYQSGRYAQSFPPMGAMLGYVQEGKFLPLLETINEKARYQKLDVIKINGAFKEGGVSYLTQHLQRSADGFVLSHLWADFRQSVA
ncbi:hypothetical protein L0337_06275 [candidate division KSB1 bacterium]|nr:hypothetical protein [candidate division KSB1 bacterium]